MFQWLKKQLVAWVEELQRREIARLQHETALLKAEIERQTGDPIQLSPEERRRLAEKAQGLDRETLEQISVFDPDDLNNSDSDES